MRYINTPSYPKQMRERAKEEGKYLFTLDIIRPSGVREICSQGPATREEAKLLCDLMFKILIDRQESSKAETLPAMIAEESEAK